MPQKKITPFLKRLVFREKNKSPYLGVRGLVDLLAEKHKITISKSTVHKILKSKGGKERAGRKSAFLGYRTRKIPSCGLFLLRAMDYQVGLFDYLTENLKNYFPRIDKDLFKELIVLASFSCLIGQDLVRSIKYKGFLRLGRLNRLAVQKVEYFNKILSQHRLVVDLRPVKDNLRLISSLKFCFNNGYEGYVDARMSTFWDGPCELEYFFLPLQAAARQIEQMLKVKALVIGYTKSFNYLSPLVINFLKGLNSGLRKIQFLDEGQQILKEMKVFLPRVELLVGYHPQMLSKGMVFLGKSQRFRRFSWPEIDEFFCSDILIKFLQPNEKEYVILKNVLIKRKVSAVPAWGLFTTFKLSHKWKDLENLLKIYLYCRPYMDREFLEEMEIIEKSYKLSQKKKDYLRRILPDKLIFSHNQDFIRVGQILSVIFKEIVWGWEPKNIDGTYTTGKDYLALYLGKIPKEVKKNFNRSCFYLEQKRVFLV